MYIDISFPHSYQSIHNFVCSGHDFQISQVFSSQFADSSDLHHLSFSWQRVHSVPINSDQSERRTAAEAEWPQSQESSDEAPEEEIRREVQLSELQMRFSSSFKRAHLVMLRCSQNETTNGAIYDRQMKGSRHIREKRRDWTKMKGDKTVLLELTQSVCDKVIIFRIHAGIKAKRKQINPSWGKQQHQFITNLVNKLVRPPRRQTFSRFLYI